MAEGSGRAAAGGGGPAEEFVRLLHPLRRAVVRAVRVNDELPSLSDAQITLLRVLVASGSSTPAQVASELHLARPTVSNLVKDLVAAGLLDRRQSIADGRSVLLVPTARARELIDTFRAGRSRALSRAFEGLPAADRERLEAALPSVRLLIGRLKEMADGETAQGAE